MNLDVVGIRLVKERTIEYEKEIKIACDAVQLIANELKDMDREVCMTVNFNTKLQVLSAHVVSVGGLDGAIVDVRSIFKSALLSNAKSIMLFHNHPSGNCSPSREDILLSQKLEKAGQVMDIPLLDHIIIGQDKYYSYKGDITQYYQLDESKKLETQENELRDFVENQPDMNRDDIELEL